MKEKLIIRNLGPIRSVELELGRFNVLIGQNGTGKSTVAKVLAVCRYFPYIVGNDILQNAFENGLRYYGLSEFIRNDTFIAYECIHYLFSATRGFEKEVEFDHEDGSIIYEREILFRTDLTSKSLEFDSLQNALEAVMPKPPEGLYGYEDDNPTIPSSFIENDVAAVLHKTFFIPTQRGLQSLFSLGKSTVQNLSDALFDQLAQIDRIARSFKSETTIEPLKITYKNIDGKGYIKKDADENYYSLFNGASGYQSTIPIVLLIKSYIELKKKANTFIIEEPELNLFPNSQAELIKFFAQAIINSENSIFLTTHSPYILTSLNNSMYAYQIGQGHHEGSNAIIDKKYWLNPDDVAVYMMLTNGTCEDIFNRDEDMIKAEKIDEISQELNKQFDLLQDVELGISEEKN